jgi:hypothetical protein
VVNGQSVVFKERKTLCASVPPVCGNIGKNFTHGGVLVVDVSSKHLENLLLDWVANQGIYDTFITKVYLW